MTTTSDSVSHTGFSLRDAIAQANTDASNGLSDLIVFASSLDGQTITLSQGELNLSGAGTGTITIDGAGQMTISGNNASTVFAVQSGVQALLQGLTIENGQGSVGGIFNDGGTLTLSDSTLAHNSAGNSGGGIYNYYGTVTVSDSTLADNSASQGGGIINNGGTLTVSDSTLADNSASIIGGGIYNYFGTVTLLSSIVAANTASYAGPDVYGSVSGSDNLIGDGSGMSGISNNDANGNLVGVTGSNPNVINPELLPLGNYGGAQTMPPAANSPALNAGGLLTTLTSAIGAAGTTFSVTDAAAISSTPGVFDLEVDGEQIQVSYASGNSFTVVQRGFNGTTQASPSSGDAVFLALDQSGRARVIGGQTDIGAAETLLVTTNSDALSHTGFSLRDALSQANDDASHGLSDLIVFASSLDGQTITLSQGELNLSGAGMGTISIDGGGRQIAISGNNASTVFAVQTGVHALLEGLTIENASGGGIYNRGTVTVSDSTLAHNSAVSGGGIYNDGGTVTVSDSTLAHNSASQSGGGIYNDGGTVTVSDSTLAYNSASQSGGGIYNYHGTVTLLSTIVAANTASSAPDVFGNVSATYSLIGVANPGLLPLDYYGGPTQTIPLAINSPALNAGGPLTTLTSSIGATDTTFTVANAAAITSTPGIFDLQVDSEQILVSYTSGLFTVVQRGYNGTTEATHSSTANVFLAQDQIGTNRVVNGTTDIGAFQDTVLVIAPSSVTAGTPFQVTIQSVTPFTGSATLLSTDGQPVFVSPITVVNGEATVWVQLNTADTIHLAAIVNSVVGYSNTITVQPGSVVALHVSPPAVETAGSAFSVTVSARDAFGNTANFNGAVTLYSSDGQQVFGSSVTLVNGVGTTQVTLDVADRLELVAVGGGLVGVSGLTTVQAATPSTVQVYAPTVVEAGVAFAVYVVARDQFGNGCTGLATLTPSDGQTGTPASVSLVNGVGVAAVTFDKADTLTLQASVNGTPGTSTSFTVDPAGLASFSVSAPSTATTKTAFGVTVTAQDAFGNTITGFTGGVVLLSSDGQPVNPNVVMLTNGVGTAQVTLNRADPIELIADYANILGYSNTITVSGPSTGAPSRSRSALPAARPPAQPSASRSRPRMPLATPPATTAP